MEMKIDGAALNTELMRNKVAMKSFLRKLAAVAEMHVIGKPTAMAYAWPGSDDPGDLSAHCYLKESSIDAHCYVDKQFAYVTVFSCKDFDEDRVKACVARSFNMPDPRVLILDRGIDPETGECIPARLRD